MIVTHISVQVVGGLICLLGVAGIFVRSPPNDGALAIAGAILLAAGTISQTLAKTK